MSLLTDRCHIKRGIQPSVQNQGIYGAVFRLTSECNLLCKYCFDSHDPKKGHMNEEVAFTALLWLIRQAKKRVNIVFIWWRTTAKKGVYSAVY